MRILATAVLVGAASYAVRPQWETAIFAGLAVAVAGIALAHRSPSGWIRGDRENN